MQHSKSVADARTIGIISDTHGILRPEVIRVFDRADLILHAGDIGNAEILESLGKIAPVIAVRGNMDSGDWAVRLSQKEALELNGVLLYMLHDLNGLDLDPVRANVRAIISGHSHRPSVSEREGTLYINPGSAGPRRFALPVTVGLLTIEDDSLGCRIVTLA